MAKFYIVDWETGRILRTNDEELAQRAVDQTGHGWEGTVISVKEDKILNEGEELVDATSEEFPEEEVDPDDHFTDPLDDIP